MCRARLSLATANCPYGAAAVVVATQVQAGVVRRRRRLPAASRNQRLGAMKMPTGRRPVCLRAERWRSREVWTPRERNDGSGVVSSRAVRMAGSNRRVVRRRLQCTGDEGEKQRPGCSGVDMAHFTLFRLVWRSIVRPGSAAQAMRGPDDRWVRVV